MEKLFTIDYILKIIFWILITFINVNLAIMLNMPLAYVLCGVGIFAFICSILVSCVKKSKSLFMTLMMVSIMIAIVICVIISLIVTLIP